MDIAFFFLLFPALVFFWPCSSWDIRMSVWHKRWSFSIFTSETWSFQGRMMSFLYHWVPQSLLPRFELRDSSTSQSSRDFSLHMNLLRKACPGLVAHNWRSCCIKGLHGCSCQPWNSRVLMISSQVLVVLLLILQSCKLELLTWQQIRVVLSVPVYEINSSYLKILIWVGTWLEQFLYQLL